MLTMTVAAPAESFESRVEAACRGINRLLASDVNVSAVAKIRREQLRSLLGTFLSQLLGQRSGKMSEEIELPLLPEEDERSDASSDSSSSAPLQLNGTAVSRLVRDTVTFSETAHGRDRVFRCFQYLGRFLFGAFQLEFFDRLTSVMALTRKSLRFWGPVKGIVELCEVDGNSSGARWLKKAGIFSDAIYRLTDHVAFAQRIGLIGKNWTKEAVDKLDRYYFTCSLNPCNVPTRKSSQDDIIQVCRNILAIRSSRRLWE